MAKNNDRDKSQVLIIAGPTASGKSGKALSLASKRRAVIINADSMQVYDALPILTACPDVRDLAAAPHRLYRFLEPSASCTAVLWREKALHEIEVALENDCLPIIVGGTGFYLKVLIEGLSPVPPVPKDIREEAIRLQRQLGNPAFHEALEQRDASMASRLHPNDTHRLIRAWEVLEATGLSLAHWQELPKESPPSRLSFSIEKIIPDREQLHSNIENRFGAMLKGGALEEVKDLMMKISSCQVPENAAITAALGYRQLASYLKGELSLKEATQLAITETRQYAKRQITWLKTQLP